MTRKPTYEDLERRIKILEEESIKSKKAEETLHENETLFRNIFEQHSAVKLIIDPVNGNIIDANAEAAEFYGWKQDKLRQMRIQDINTLSPEEIQLEMEKAKSKDKTHFEFRHRRADGSIRDVEVFSSEIQSKGKKLLHSIVHDITYRKQAEEALRESEERFRTIFENSSSAMAIVEKDTTISMVNKEYCKIGLFEEKDVIGKSWTTQIPPEDLERLKEYNRRRLVDPKSAPDHYEFTFYRKDGKIRHSLMSVAIIPTSQKIVCSFVDITERKQAEEALEEERRRLQQVLDEVKTLRGIVPICANCKKIRDDKGFWNQVERYVGDHTEAEFSHGICPDCAKVLYPELYEKEQVDEKP